MHKIYIFLLKFILYYIKNIYTSKFYVTYQKFNYNCLFFVNFWSRHYIKCHTINWQNIKEGEGSKSLIIFLYIIPLTSIYFRVFSSTFNIFLNFYKPTSTGGLPFRIKMSVIY